MEKVLTKALVINHSTFTVLQLKRILWLLSILTLLIELTGVQLRKVVLCTLGSSMVPAKITHCQKAFQLISSHGLGQ